MPSTEREASPNVKPLKDLLLQPVSLSGIAPVHEHRSIGGVAQLGERLLCTQEASGSNPLISTSGWHIFEDIAPWKDFGRNPYHHGSIAQLVRAHA